MSAEIIQAGIDLARAAASLADSERVVGFGRRAPIKTDQRAFVAAARRFIRVTNGTNTDYAQLLIALGHQNLLTPAERL